MVLECWNQTLGHLKSLKATTILTAPKLRYFVILFYILYDLFYSYFISNVSHFSSAKEIFFFQSLKHLPEKGSKLLPHLHSRKHSWKGLPLAHCYLCMWKGGPFQYGAFPYIFYFLSGGSWRWLRHPLVAYPGPTPHALTQLMSSYHLLEETHNRFSVMHFTLTAGAAE